MNVADSVGADASAELEKLIHAGLRWWVSVGLLPWLGWGGDGIKAFHIPFAYRWNQNPQQSGFSIGVVAATVAAGPFIHGTQRWYAAP